MMPAIHPLLPQMEPLPQRILLAASVSDVAPVPTPVWKTSMTVRGASLRIRQDGTMIIKGSRRDDSLDFTFMDNMGIGEPNIALAFNGQWKEIPRSFVKRIVVRLGAGDDFFSLHSNHFGNGVEVGFAIAATIVGGAGDDTLNGGMLGDLIVGGRGNDSIVGGAGCDMIRGGSGDDYIDGDDDRDIIRGGLGTDQLVGEGGEDTIFADQSDQVIGGGGQDVVKRK